MSENTNNPGSDNTGQAQSSGQDTDRPSLVEPSVMVQRSADGDRVRVTERSDVRYFSRDRATKDGGKKD